jgi:hypothetical protein
LSQFAEALLRRNAKAAIGVSPSTRSKTGAGNLVLAVYKFEMKEVRTL